MKLNDIVLHPCFKLNGNSFSTTKELISYSRTLDTSISQFFIDWFSEESYIEVQTSGSTGTPKRIRLKKEYMINSANATASFFQLPENTTALLCMSVDFIAGKMMLVRAMVLGWDLDMVKPISNPLKNNTKTYDFSAMVPMQLENSLLEISRIKTLIVGGGIVSEILIEKLQSLKTAVFATFGMTETITHISVKKLNHFKTINISSQAKLRDKKSYYTVFPGISISQDNRNCLVIVAPKVADEIIITNDVVEIISKNEFKWLGRFDNVINSGGIKLHPEAIEKQLSKIIKERFFVAGIPDEILGEKLVLVIEGNSAQDEVEKSLKKMQNLTKYEIPKAIYFVDEFIETETKKIQRLKTLDLLFK